MTRRRCFQLSLRSFLIFVTVLALGIGWLETCARKQQHSIERIKQLGGSVHFDYERTNPDDPDEGWSATDQVPWPAWLGESRGRYLFATVEQIYLADCNRGDEVLSHASDFPDLLALVVDSSNATDRGVTSIQALQKLDALAIVHCELTDQSINDLASLKSLKTLALFGNNITREGEARLRKALPDCTIYPIHR